MKRGCTVAFAQSLPHSEAMQGVLEFGGQQFMPLGEAGLYWPAQHALLVADLHLEKASSYAVTSGQMLPPYDSVATLSNLERAAKECAARHIICLGDNFHDSGGEARLGGEAAERLSKLTKAYDWHWIIGNHDPDVGGAWGGTVHAQMQMAGIMLRHNVVHSDTRPEISGHYHPKLRIKLRGRMVSRRCFLQVGNRLVMPAFGALTGGMDAKDVHALLSQKDTAYAYLGIKGQMLRFVT